MGLTSGTVFLVIYYFAYAALVSVPFLLQRRTWAAIDPFEPYWVLSAVLFFYSTSALTGFEIDGLTTDLEAVSPGAIFTFAIACLLGQAGLACGELLGPKGTFDRVRAKNYSEIGADPYIKTLVGPGLAIALLLLPFYADRFDFINVESYADVAFESRLLRMEDANAGLKDVFLRDMPTTVLLCAATAIMLDSMRSALPRLLATAVMVAYLLTSLFAGARGSIVSAGLLLLILYNYRIREISKPALIAVAVATYLMVNILSIARGSSNPLEMLSLLNEKITTEGYGFLDISQSGELRTSVNLVRLIVGIEGGEDHFRFGGITWDTILSNVPRNLWPDRPLTGSEHFVEVFYPGTLAAGGGYGNFIYQDPYWDFGVVGVFAWSLLLGWGIRKAYVVLIVKAKSHFWSLVYAIFFGNLAIFVVRNGIFASGKNGLIYAGPLLLIALVAKWWEPSRSTGIEPASDNPRNSV